MNKFLAITSGYNRLWLIVKVLHFIYLGLLLTFIYFYSAYYQPLKLHSLCAESSAKKVLAGTTQIDPYTYYLELYKSCLSKR